MRSRMASTVRYSPIDARPSRPVANGAKGVYIYTPADKSKPSGERPSKRRKVVPEKEEEQKKVHLFMSLLNGEEDEQSVEARYRTYQRLWSTQEAKIQVSRNISLGRGCWARLLTCRSGNSRRRRLRGPSQCFFLRPVDVSSNVRADRDPIGSSPCPDRRQI